MASTSTYNINNMTTFNGVNAGINGVGNLMAGNQRRDTSIVDGSDVKNLNSIASMYTGNKKHSPVAAAEDTSRQTSSQATLYKPKDSTFDQTQYSDVQMDADQQWYNSFVQSIGPYVSLTDQEKELYSHQSAILAANGEDPREWAEEFLAVNGISNATGLSREDVYNHQQELEDYFVGGQAPHLNFTWGYSIINAFNNGVRQQELAGLKDDYRQLMVNGFTEDSPEAQYKLNQIQKANEQLAYYQDNTPHWWGVEKLNDAVSQIPYMMVGQASGFAGGFLGKAIGFAFGGAAGAKIGGAVGGYLARFLTYQGQFAGDAYWNMREAGVSNETALKYSAVDGLINGANEALLDVVFDIGAGKLGISKALYPKFLDDFAVSSSAAKYGMRVLYYMGTEGNGEFIQEGSESLTSSFLLNKALKRDGLEQISWDERAKDALNEAIMGWTCGVMFAGGQAAVHTVTDVAKLTYLKDEAGKYYSKEAFQNDPDNQKLIMGESLLFGTDLDVDQAREALGNLWTNVQTARAEIAKTTAQNAAKAQETGKTAKTVRGQKTVNRTSEGSIRTEGYGYKQTAEGTQFKVAMGSSTDDAGNGKATRYGDITVKVSKDGKTATISDIHIENGYEGNAAEMVRTAIENYVQGYENVVMDDSSPLAQEINSQLTSQNPNGSSAGLKYAKGDSEAQEKSALIDELMAGKGYESGNVAAVPTSERTAEGAVVGRVSGITREEATLIANVVSNLAKAKGLTLNQYLEKYYGGRLTIDPTDNTDTRIANEKGVYSGFSSTGMVGPDGILTNLRGLVHVAASGDFSTFQHEVFHINLRIDPESRADLAKSISDNVGDSSRNAKLKDYIEKHMEPFSRNGFKDADAVMAELANIKTGDDLVNSKLYKAEEALDSLYEAWLADDNKRTANLPEAIKELFQKIAKAMQNIYRSLKGQNVQIDEDIEKAFAKAMNFLGNGPEIAESNNAKQTVDSTTRHQGPYDWTAAEDLNDVLTQEEAVELAREFESDAEKISLFRKLNEQNWKEEFGEGLKIKTPFGEIKLGENQSIKLMANNGRENYWEMLRPTLERPSFVLLETGIQNRDNAGHPFAFYKTFETADDNKKWYIAVSISIGDNGQIVVSNHRTEIKNVIRDLKKSPIAYISYGNRMAGFAKNYWTVASLNSNNTVSGETVNRNQGNIYTTEADNEFKELSVNKKELIESPYLKTAGSNPSDKYKYATSESVVNDSRRQGQEDVNSENFKNWFGNSVVVNEDGSPKILYHGSPVSDIDVFDNESRYSINGGEKGLTYVTDDETFAEAFSHETTEGDSVLRRIPTGNVGEVYPLYVRLENPLDFRNLPENIIDLMVKEQQEEQGVSESRIRESISHAMEADNEQFLKSYAEKLLQHLPDYGYDGIIARLGKRYGDALEYAVVSPTQVKSATSNNGDFDGENPNIRYQKVEDAGLLARLESEPTIKVLRAMQVIDGKLYPPMAAVVGGSMVEPTELGDWYQADEHPELLNKDGKFVLDKGSRDSSGGKLTKVPAAYNPYWHTSRSFLNDQFSSAYKRPNLVTVECEVPESELSSGYKADGAKDAVGEVEWHSGPVSSQLARQGNPRRVILSRYVKVDRIVPEAEVAQGIADMLKDTGIFIPEETVTPQLRAELEKAGVPIQYSDKVKDFYASIVPQGTPAQIADIAYAIRRQGNEGYTHTTLVQMMMEANPSVSIDLLPGYHDASTTVEQQQEFAEAIHAALVDENGYDVIDKILGIKSKSVNGSDHNFGIGVYAGNGPVQISVGQQNLIEAETDEYGNITDEFVKKLNTSARVHAIFLRQDAVTWGHLSDNANVSKQSGINLRLGRNLTKDEMVDLVNTIGNQDYGVLATPTGAWIGNFSENSNEQFQSEATKALDEWSEKWDNHGMISPVVYDGDYLSIDWNKGDNGYAYPSHFDESGNEERVFRAGYNAIHASLQEVYNRFSEKYNWGNSGEIPRPEDVTLGKQGDSRHYRVGTRKFSDAKLATDPSAHGLESVLKSKDLPQKIADTLQGKAIAGQKGEVQWLPGAIPLKRSGREKAETYLKRVVDYGVKNVKTVFDSISQGIKDIESRWYDTAHAYAVKMADIYGITLAQASAAIACVSPNYVWTNNIALADIVADIMTNASGSKPTERMQTFLRDTWKWNEDRVSSFASKTLSEMTDEEAKNFIVVAIQSGEIDKSYLPLVEMGVGTTGRAAGKFGLTMGSGPFIKSAVSVIRDGSIENIGNQLSSQAKVRSFYNNILNPESDRAEVTADTWALRDAFLGMDPEFAKAMREFLFQGPASRGTGLTGVLNEVFRQVTDSINADEAAKGSSVRYLPHQIQSITWSGIKAAWDAANANGNESIRADLDEKWKSGDVEGIREIFAQLIKDNPLSHAFGTEDPGRMLHMRAADSQLFTSDLGTDHSDTIGYTGLGALVKESAERTDKAATVYYEEGGVKGIRDKVMYQGASDAETRIQVENYVDDNIGWADVSKDTMDGIRDDVMRYAGGIAVQDFDTDEEQQEAAGKVTGDFVAAIEGVDPDLINGREYALEFPQETESDERYQGNQWGKVYKTDSDDTTTEDNSVASDWINTSDLNIGLMTGSEAAKDRMFFNALENDDVVKSIQERIPALQNESVEDAKLKMQEQPRNYRQQVADAFNRSDMMTEESELPEIELGSSGEIDVSEAVSTRDRMNIANSITDDTELSNAIRYGEDFDEVVNDRLESSQKSIDEINKLMSQSDYTMKRMTEAADAVRKEYEEALKKSQEETDAAEAKAKGLGTDLKRTTTNRDKWRQKAQEKQKELDKYNKLLKEETDRFNEYKRTLANREKARKAALDARNYKMSLAKSLTRKWTKSVDFRTVAPVMQEIKDKLTPKFAQNWVYDPINNPNGIKGGATMAYEDAKRLVEDMEAGTIEDLVGVTRKEIRDRLGSKLYDQLSGTGAQPLDEWSIQDLERLKSRLDQAWEEGRKIQQAREEARQERQHGYINSILDHIMKTDEYKKNKGHKVSGAANNATGRDLFRSFRYSVKRMQELVGIMDGVDGTENRSLLVEQVRDANEEETRAVERRVSPVYQIMKTVNFSLGKSAVEDFFYQSKFGFDFGTGENQYTGSALAYVYLSQFNEKAKQAVAYGNLVDTVEKGDKDLRGNVIPRDGRTITDDDELKRIGMERYNSLLQFATKTLNEKGMMSVVEAIQADLENPENSKSLLDFSLDVWNQPVVMEEHYLPIRRTALGGGQEINDPGQINMVTGNYLSSVKKGFLEEKQNFNPRQQSEVRLDLMGVWLDSVRQQEHLKSTGVLLSDINRVYEQSKMVRDTIERAYGREMLTEIEDYTKYVADPNFTEAKNDVSKVVRFFQGSTAASYLSFKLSSVFTQLIASPAPFLGEAKVTDLLKGYAMMSAHPMQSWEFVSAKSTMMANRSADMMIDAIEEAKQDPSAKPYQRWMAKAQGVGMLPLEWVDKYCVAGGWLGVYNTRLDENLANGMSAEEADKAAVKAADEVVYRTQPTGTKTELSRLFRTNNAILKLVLQFQSAMNVVYNNVAGDMLLDYRKAKAGDRKAVQRIIGHTVGYVMAGIILGAVQEGLKKDDDDTKEKAAARTVFQILNWGISQGVESVPWIGSIVSDGFTSLLTGKVQGYSSDTLFPAASDVFGGLSKVLGAVWSDDPDKRISLVKSGGKTFFKGLGLSLGLPTSGINQVVKAYEEKSFLPLLGRY